MTVDQPGRTRAGAASWKRAVVVGSGASGLAATRLLRQSGVHVRVIDDAPSEASRVALQTLGVDLVELQADTGPEAAQALLVGVDLLVPSPGVPEHHRVVDAAIEAGITVRSELELAWQALPSSFPLVAVTGTNGKTTVVTLINDMLVRSGRSAVAAGNIGLALSDVVDDVAAGTYEMVVAEVSSFQLRFTDAFRPHVAVWLNLAPDHLDWHADVEAYAAAKARVWARQGIADTAVVNASDPVVMAAARTAPGRIVTFGPGHDGTEGDVVPDGVLETKAAEDHERAEPIDWQVKGGVLLGPSGATFAVTDRVRHFPHERANVAAAAAAAVAAGATSEGVTESLLHYQGLAHRLTLVAERDGVRWYDDSKATNPAAAVAAMNAFSSVVLVAGGRNKGLDLSEMAVAFEQVRAVVAIGEAAGEVAAAFSDVRPVRLANSMDDAVRLAGDAAYPGDAVLLSPGCASFDWYHSYAERGDDFARAVHSFLNGESR